LLIALVPLMIAEYLASCFVSSFGHFPWWTMLFICAYGTAGFLIRKAAVWELRRQKALQKGAE
jgi:hypothetical protein